MREEAAAANRPAPKPAMTWRPSTQHMSEEQKAAHRKRKMASNAVNMRAALQDQTARRFRCTAACQDLAISCAGITCMQQNVEARTGVCIPQKLWVRD